MNLLERLNKYKENRIFNKIRSGNIDEQALIKAFKRSSNKTDFIAKCVSEMNFRLPESLVNAILEVAKSDKQFLMNMPYIGQRNGEIDSLVISKLDANDIVRNPNILELLSFAKRLEILEGVDIELITPEAIKKLIPYQRKQFISSMRIEKVQGAFVDVLEEEDKSDLAKQWINNENISIQRLNEILGQDYLKQMVQNIIREKPENLSQRLVECVPEEDRDNLFVLAKLVYSLQRETDESIKDNIMSIYDTDKYFREYLSFRNQNNINTSDIGTERSVFPISDIMREYNTNAELIKSFFESEQYQDRRMQLLLKYYIQDNKNTSAKVVSVDELIKYPEQALNRQKKITMDGDRTAIVDMITQILTGLSSKELSMYRSMFLENHDIEAVLESTEQDGEKLRNLTIVNEILDLVETMNEEQLQEFATNLSIRNYNELMHGDFSLVEMRENFGDFLAHIKEEYGKEINQSLGYKTKEAETILYKGKNVNIKDIIGEFKILIHRTGRMINPYNGLFSVSLNSEGFYEHIDLQGHEGDLFFVFDSMPEELLFASAGQDLGSDHNSDRLSNFRTAENTILTSEPVMSAYIEFRHTEQAYFAQGFSNNEFVKISPTALATYEKEPNEHTLQIAAQYGLDILRIPDMQTNLNQMLENGIVTPSLVKGFKGDSRRIIDVLSGKSFFTKKEVLALQTLRRKESGQEIQQEIDELLERIPKAKGKEEILSLVDDIKISDLRGISEETRRMYELINNPQSTREKQ